MKTLRTVKGGKKEEGKRGGNGGFSIHRDKSMFGVSCAMFQFFDHRLKGSCNYICCRLPELK